MTTIQTTPSTDTLIATPTTITTTAARPTPTKSRRTTAIVVTSIAALAIAGVAGAVAYRAQDDAQPTATVPAVVGTIEDDSAIVHGGAGQLSTVEGLPLGTSGAATNSTTAPTSTVSDPTVGHGSGDDVVTGAGRVHG